MVDDKVNDAFSILSRFLACKCRQPIICRREHWAVIVYMDLQFKFHFENSRATAKMHDWLTWETTDNPIVRCTVRLRAVLNLCLDGSGTPGWPLSLVLFSIFISCHETNIDLLPARLCVSVCVNAAIERTNNNNSETMHDTNNHEVDTFFSNWTLTIF